MVRAQALPPATGWRWILAGFALYRRNPLVLSALFVAYWFVVMFVGSLPLVGSLFASLLVPGLSVGLMQAARNVERGVPIGMPTLFASFRDNPRTLLALGGLYLCCTLGALAASAIVDGGEFLRFMLSNDQLERAALKEADFTLSILVTATLMIPVAMAWWFAPALAAWHRLSLGRALFFSFVACQMNWRPFLTYAMGLMLIAAMLPAMLLGILMAIQIPPNLALALIMTPLLLIVMPAVFASFYAGYRDVFAPSEIV